MKMGKVVNGVLFNSSCRISPVGGFGRPGFGLGHLQGSFYPTGSTVCFRAGLKTFFQRVRWRQGVHCEGTVVPEYTLQDPVLWKACSRGG